MSTVQASSLDGCSNGRRVTEELVRELKADDAMASVAATCTIGAALAAALAVETSVTDVLDGLLHSKNAQNI